MKRNCKATKTSKVPVERNNSIGPSNNYHCTECPKTVTVVKLKHKNMQIQDDNIKITE